MRGFMVWVLAGCRAGSSDDTGGSPTVAISSHRDGDRIGGDGAFTLEGTVQGADTVTVAIGDEAPRPAEVSDGVFSLDGAVPDGETRIEVVARGPGGEASAAVLVGHAVRANLSTFAAASFVLGQPTPGELDGSTLSWTYGRAAWAWDERRLYLPDSDHHRVLAFGGFPSEDGAAADLVLGQRDASGASAGGGASGFDFPETVVVAGDQRLVLDYGNARVLGWDAPPTASGAPADFVIGQVDFDRSEVGCGPDRVNYPDDLTIAGGWAILSDRENHRVLLWDHVPRGVEPATLVLGQADLDHCAANDDAQSGVPGATPTARTLSQPSGVWSDGERLVVVDVGNHRVLVWSTFPTASFTPADVVLGQPDAVSAAPGAGDGLAYPSLVDSNGTQLAVADTGNHRVLVWEPFPTATAPPTFLLGQADAAGATPNDDDQDGVPDGAASRRTLFEPTGVSFVREVLLVGDAGNQRVLAFGDLPCPAGTAEPADVLGTCR